MTEIDFTWDENKRQITLQERGLDFADMKVFDWETAIFIEDVRQDYPEVRFVSTGFLRQDLVVCAWCYRESKTRIISLRKANKRERKHYEKAIAALD